MSIGGNVYAFIQCRTVETDEIGAQVENWVDVQKVRGWLDLTGGDSKHTNYNTKLQESTHVFVADYVALNDVVTAENSRAVIAGKRYDVLLIDDPMEMHKQLEIYLKYTGGQ